MAACRLFGGNKQVYYRRVKSEQDKQEAATKAVSLVQQVRMM